MRWKTQWKQLLLLLLVLVVLGVIQADQELKPLPDAVITTVQERVEIPKPQWTASGNDRMLVNAFQTYGFVAFSFVVLMAAQNLVQLRTSIQLTRYATWSAYRKRTFCRLMGFSTVFYYGTVLPGAVCRICRTYAVVHSDALPVSDQSGFREALYRDTGDSDAVLCCQRRHARHMAAADQPVFVSRL